MRGEKFLPPEFQARLSGSPPHARGKAIQLVKPGLDVRITPACAGKSFNDLLKIRTSWDHPRMRGEKALFLLSGQSSGGSPPHARGKGVIFHFPLTLFRITPACAGKS